MRCFLLLIVVLFSIEAFSQRMVSGRVYDEFGDAIPGVSIYEIRAERNATVSNIDGFFQIITTTDICFLSFSFLSFKTDTIKITQDTTLNIVLTVNHGMLTGHPVPACRLTDIALESDVINRLLGISFRTGDMFSRKFSYWVTAQTNFNTDYLFGTGLEWLDAPYKFKLPITPTIGFKQYNYSSEDFFHRDVYLSLRLPIRHTNSSLIFKTGYQTLNDYNNMGTDIGFQGFLNYQRQYFCHYGIFVGYYFDYLTYSAYIQRRLPNFFGGFLTYRLAYERLDKHNMLNLGLIYSFCRL